MPRPGRSYDPDSWKFTIPTDHIAEARKQSAKIKPWTRKPPASGAREENRRKAQILAQSLTRSNGLVT